MHLIVWRYRVAPAQAARFEKIYGPDGDWARLFRKATGYRGTELIRGGDGTWATIDRWESAEAWQAARDALGEEYARLDAACDALTLEEEKLIEGEAV